MLKSKQTHNITLTSGLADFIVSIGGNGTVLSQGSDISLAISRNSSLMSEMRTAENFKAYTTPESDSFTEKIAPPNNAPKGKLIVAEEIQEGYVMWKAMKLFLSSLGGNHPAFFFFAYSLGLLITDLGTMAQTYFLGYWGTQYDDHKPNEINPFLCVALKFIGASPFIHPLPV